LYEVALDPNRDAHRERHLEAQRNKGKGDQGADKGHGNKGYPGKATTPAAAGNFDEGVGQAKAHVQFVDLGKGYHGGLGYHGGKAPTPAIAGNTWQPGQAAGSAADAAQLITGAGIVPPGANVPPQGAGQQPALPPPARAAWDRGQQWHHDRATGQWWHRQDVWSRWQLWEQ
jgi:hypothetical protein